MLGTNDAQTYAVPSAATDFSGDAARHVGAYRSLPSRPAVLLAVPPPIYPGKLAVFFNATRANVDYPRLIPSIAAETAAETVDVFDALGRAGQE